MKSGPARAWRPRLVPTLATVAGVALFIHLGWWQHTKAVASQAAATLAARQGSMPPTVLAAAPLAASQAQWLHLAVHGRYEAERQFFVDNRQEQGVDGVHVITPLRIGAGPMRVLVDRGWIAWPHGRGTLPEAPVPAGEIDITGTGRIPSTKAFFLMPDRPESDPRLWRRVDLARYAAWTNEPVQPFLLVQDPGGVADGLVRRASVPEDRTLMHQGYALQWFAMAAGLLVFHAVASWRRIS